MSAAYEHAIRNELDYWPGAKVQFSKRAKHDQATLHFNGQTRFVTIAASPSDERRGALNMLADVRKELRALGAVKLPRKPALRKRKNKVIGTRHPAREQFAHIERAPVKANPFDALAGFVPTPAPAPIAVPATRWQRFVGWLLRKFSHLPDIHEQEEGKC